MAWKPEKRQWDSKSKIVDIKTINDALKRNWEGNCWTKWVRNAWSKRTVIPWNLNNNQIELIE